MTDKKRLLVVDDEPDIGEFIRDVALEQGFDARSIDRASEFEQVYTDDLDVVVLDLIMPEQDGVELLRYLANRNSGVKIILISGYDSSVLHAAQKLAAARGLQVIDTLSKPILYEDLVQLLADLPLGSTRSGSAKAHSRGLPDGDELSAGFAQNQLQAYYQPQLEMASGRLFGVEALIRWQHPRLGLLAPDLIIPLADEQGLMDQLSASMLSQALEQVSSWAADGVFTRVSINMDAVNFRDLSLPERIGDSLRYYGLHPNQVSLEVTETSLMQELIQSLDILTRLRMKGIELSIDDFGTGYSSLQQLYRIPFSELKIDRSFVMHATTDVEARSIVKITILLAHELGMKVVAEGVEDKPTWDLLVELGCDRAQGYFIARPMPGEDFQAWIEANPKLVQPKE